MNEGQVGKLNVVLTGDASQFDAAMKKAATGSDVVQKSVSKLGDQMQKLTPQAERMVKSFGGDKLLYQANNLTAAVQKLGGAQKLTEANQARINKTLTEAIAQYRVLGQTAPAAMTKLAAETSRAAKPMDALAKGMSLAGKEATASSKLIAGMSQSGRAELTRLTQATTQSVSAFQRIGTALGPLGSILAATFTIGAVVNFGRQITAFAGQMVDLSDETGISTSRLQAWDRVLSQSGLTVEQLVRAATELQKRLGNDDDSAATAMGKLGLRAQELIQMKPDEAVIKIVEATSRLGTQSEKTATLFELLGKVGPRMLRVASEDLGKTIDEISKSNDVIREDLILKADQFDDQLDRIIKSMKARVVNFIGWYMDRQKQIGLLPFGLDLPNAPLGSMQIPNAPGKPSMFSPAVRGAQAPAGLPPDFVQTLANAKKAVAELTKTDRDQILASQQSGASAAESAEMLKRYGLEAYSLQLVLSLLNEKTKETKVQAEDITKKYKTLTEALGATQWAVSNLTTQQRAEIDAGVTLGQTTDEIAKKLGLATQVVAAYTDQTKEAAAWQKEMTAEIEKFIQATMKAAAEAANLRGLTQAARVIASTVNITEADKGTADAAKRIAIQRAEFEAEQAEKAGASWQMVFAMQQQASKMRLQVDLDAEDERFRKITRTLDEGSAEFQAYTAEHNKNVQAMAERFQQGEELKRQELIRTHDVWGQRWAVLQDQITSSMSDSIADMLTGLRGFKDGWLDIWRSIRQSFSNILASMVNDYLTGFLKRIIGASAGMSIGVGGGPLGAATNLGGAAALGGIFSGGAGAGLGTLSLGAATTSVAAVDAAAIAAGAAAGGGAAAGTAVAGTAAAGGGLGATIAGLATNPFTIAAAAAIGGFVLWKKFGKSEESKEVSPRREKFFGQFGGDSRFAKKLTDALVNQRVPEAGNVASGFMKRLYGAHTLKDWQSAEHSAVGAMGQFGRGVKFYNLGGFVPPGQVQPAMLHGGSMGEIVAPVEKLMQMQQRSGDVHLHASWQIHAVDAKGIRDMVKSSDFADAFVHVIRNNRHFLTSEVRKTL